MPRTKTGKKVWDQMIEKYGPKKASEVYYGSIVKGKPGSSKWEGKKPKGKLAKAKRTYRKRHASYKK